MPAYTYTAVVDGETKSGSLEALNTAKAAALVMGMGHKVQIRHLAAAKTRPTLTLGTTQQQAEAGRKEKTLFVAPWERPSLRHVSIFCKNIATSLRAGIPLTTALENVGKGTPNKVLQDAIEQACKEMEAGQSFSAALRTTKVFPALMVNLIVAAEDSGAFDETFRKLADYYKNEASIAAKLKAAMTYPGFILTIALGITYAMLTMIVPQFATLLTNQGDELPGLTKAVLGVSSFLQANGWMLLIGLVLAFVVFNRITATASGKKLLDRLLLRLPIFGPLIKNRVLTQVTSTLALLLTRGIDIINALRVVRSVAGNTVYQESIDHISENYRNGRVMSESMHDKRNAGLYPLLLISMIETGESSGALDEILEDAAENFTEEVENTTASLSSLIEPFMIVGLGLLVGLIVAACFLPILKSVSSFG